MKETKIFENKTARVPVVNSQLYQQPNKNKDWIIIKGSATSQIRSRSSSDTPYYAFFALENNVEHLDRIECANA